MQQPRRTFLAAAVTMAAASALRAAQQSGQPNQPNQPGPMNPVSQNLPGAFSHQHDDIPPLKIDPHAVMKANQDAVRKDVARMSELIQQLQKNLDANSSKDVLSLDVLKTCDEIEKLAKQVKDKVRS